MSTRLLSLAALAAISISLSMAVSGWAAPSIQVMTDKATYHSGDSIEVSLAAQNPGDAVDVDAYIGLLFPDATLWTYTEGGWSGDVLPWLAGLSLPAGLDLPQTPFFHFGVPDGVEGDFQFAAAFTKPSAFEFLSAPSFAPFSIGSGTVATTSVYVNPESGNDANDGGESAPLKTITRALQMAALGAESGRIAINLAAGTYAASTNGETYPLNIPSNTYLIGDAHEKGDPVILDAEESSRAIAIDSATDAGLFALTITNGNAGAESGGGVLCEESSLIVRDCLIRDCVASSGGGVMCEQQSNIAVFRTTFVNNSATQHSGGGLETIDSSVQIKDSGFDGNTSSGSGGGLYHSGIEDPNQVSLSLERNYFLANDSGEDGGALVARNANLEASNNHFENNTAAWDGGALHAYASEGYQSEVKLEWNYFASNSAGNNGGAVASQDVAVNSQNETFESNSAGGDGGALDLSWAMVPASYVGLEDEDNYYAGNTADGDGGAMALNIVKGVTLEILSISLEDNSSGGDGGACFIESGDHAGNILLVYGDFSRNTAGGNGGALATQDVLVNVADSTFTDNSAANGGGLHCATTEDFVSGQETFTYTISDSQFDGNAAGEDGGGVHIVGPADEAILVVPRSSFSNVNMDQNTASQNGGAIATENVDVEAADCSFYANTAGEDGGCVHIAGPSDPAAIVAPRSIFHDVSMDENSAGQNGGAIAARNADVEIEDSSIYGNTAVQDGGCLFTYGPKDMKTKPHTGLACVNFDLNGATRNGGVIAAENVDVDVTGCYFTDNTAANGGCFYLKTTLDYETGRVEVNLDQTDFDFNSASQNGGAIAAENTGINATDCSFMGNYSEDGGCFHLKTTLNYETGLVEVNLNDTDFDSNSATQDGGAVMAEDATVSATGGYFANNTATNGGCFFLKTTSNFETGLVEVKVSRADFEYNSATQDGGAVFASGSTVNIIDAGFSGNSAGRSGGAMHFTQTRGRNVLVTNNYFEGNNADYGSAIGIGPDSGAPSILNNLFESNFTNFGGTVYLSYSSSPIFYSNTFALNVAGNGQGGALAGDSETATVRDCIFWQNGLDFFGPITATYSAFSTETAGEGNIHPELVFDASRSLEDYYLDPASPCVNAGSRTAEAAGLSGMTTQRSGTPDTGQVDMGYHYPIPPE